MFPSTFTSHRSGRGRSSLVRRLATLSLATLPLATLVVSLAGCAAGSGGSNIVQVQPAAAPAFGGKVMGGNQPVSGASIGIWAVDTTGASAKSLLKTGATVTTDANGNFSLTGTYNACASASTQVYITAFGGNPGLSTGTTNNALALMTALGSCGQYTTNPSAVYITINEVTTVASVWALQQFIGVSEGTPFAEDVAVGTGTQSALGMQNAFTTVFNLMTLSSGTAYPSVVNASIETAKINTIANILATCVNSDGTTACQTLFNAVTPAGKITAGDTIQAALYMAANPTNNVTNLFNLVTGTPPFQPSLGVAPYDWTLAITYTGSGLAQPMLLTVDGSGNIWITDAQSGSSGLVELSPAGQPMSGSPFLTGGTISSPQTIAVDTTGKIWVANHSSSANNLITFNPATNTFVSHSASTGCQPYSMALDGSNNAFFTCDSIANLFELQNTGTPAVPVYGSPATEGTVGGNPEGIAVDSNANVWVTSQSAATVTEFKSGAYASPVNAISTSNGPYGVAIDHSNNVWVADSNVLYQLVNGGSSYTTVTYTGGGINSPRYIAADGAGNLWIANSGTSTFSGATYVSMSEFNNSGLAQSPGLTTTAPGGFAHAVTATSPAPRGIAVDPSGNVWMAGCGLSSSCTNSGGAFVMELVGQATPVVTPLASAVANNQLGCCAFTPVAPAGTVPTNLPGQLSLQAATFSPVQNNGQFAFLVTRLGGSNGAVSVNYSTANGTLRAGTDYTSASGTLTWASGDTSVRTITVPFLVSANYTGTKSFTVNLTGVSGGATISPVATTTVNVTDNLAAPSSHFAMSGSTYQWKLQLPIDIYGGTGGINAAQYADQEVSNSTLAAGFSDPYFYFDGVSGLVFTAPSNGATTSPGVGTNDARSELRELYTGPGADGNNDWNSTTNSGAGGTLTAACSLQATSVDTNEATIGQIHGQSNPFVLLKYRPATNDVAIAISTTNTSGSASTTTALATGISLNTPITYTLKYSGSTVVATVNGNTQSFPIDSSWAGTPQYFKIGAYSGAPSTGNPAGDKTQVTFTSFSITH